MQTAANLGATINMPIHMHRWRAAFIAALLFLGLLAANPARALSQTLGDLDANGVVDVRDLVILINHIQSSAGVPPAGGTGILPVQLRGYADVNGDGYINQADIEMLADAILGIPITTRPRPLVADPASGASEVGVTVRPRVYFPKPILPASLNSNNFFASFSGRKLPARIVPANDGTFAWLFFETNMPNASQIQVTVDGSTISVINGEILDADADFAPGGLFKFNFSTVSIVGIPNTVLSSRIVDPGLDLIPRTADDVTPGGNGFNYLLPIPGVKVYVLGQENNMAYTDVDGRFTLTNMPVGDVKVVIDGRTATDPPAGYYFPEMVMDTTFEPGITNAVMTIRNADGNVVRDGNGVPIQALAMYLPRVASNILQTVSAGMTNLITLRSNAAYDLPPAQQQYLTLEIMPNSLVGMDGQPLATGLVGVSVVPTNLVQDMLPPGLLQHTFDITVQAPGIAAFNTPAPMTFPNVFNAPPGTKLNFLSFDHTTGRLVIEGTAKVSEDGLFVRTDPGTGITHPGWHGLAPPGDMNKPPPPPPVVTGCPPFDECALKCYRDLIICLTVPTSLAELDKIAYCSDAVLEKISDPDLRRAFKNICELLDLIEEAECYLDFGSCVVSCVPRLAQCLPNVPAPVLVAPLALAALEEIAAALTELAPILLLAASPDALPLNVPALMLPPDAIRLNDNPVSQATNLFAQANDLVGGDAVQYLRNWLRGTQTSLSESVGELSGNAPSYAISYAASILGPNGVFQIRGEAESFGQYSIFVGADETLLNISFYDFKQNSYGLVVPNLSPTSPYRLPRLYLAPVSTNFPDTDQDGLADVVEEVYGTDPTKFSTANDGISDGAKVAAGLDPLGGRPFATGPVAILPMPGIAKEVIIEGSMLSVEQQTAYVALGARGLGIVNASQFREPILLGQLDLSGDATDVAVDSNLRIALVAADVGGLHFVDVADPLNPRLLQTIGVAATQVEVVDGMAYVAAGPHLLSYDIANRERLQTLPLGTDNLMRLAREGTLLYTMDSSLLLRVIDVSGPNMIPRGSLTMPVGGKLFVGGGIAFLGAGRDGGFATADVSNPDTLRLLSGADAANIEGTAIAANGSGLAVAVGTVIGPMGLIRALDVLDVSNPTNTDRFLTRFSLPADPFSVAIASGIAFVANGSAGLQIVNYVSFDRNGQAPVVTITAPPTDLDPNRSGIQVQEASLIRVHAQISDDVQVRNVELLLNGQVVRNDVSFPFDLSTVLPVLASGVTNVELRVRATDTGGNIGLSAPVVLELVPDTFPPSLVSINPPNGAVRGQNFHAVTLRFSEPIGPASVSAATVVLNGPSGAIAPLDILFPNSGASVQLTYPVLAPGIYQISVDAATVRDRAGNALGLSNLVSSFEIREAFAVWTSPGSGFWDEPFNWGGTLPTTNDDVLIDVPGDILVTYRQGTTILRSLRTKNRLVMSGGTLVVSNTFEVGAAFTMSGGTLRRATVIAGPDVPRIAFIGSPTLDGVRLDIDATAGTGTSSASVTVINGLTLNATLTLYSAGGPDVFTALANFSGGQQTLAGDGQVIFTGVSFDNGTVQPVNNGQLTIGPGITIRSGNIGGVVGNDSLVLINRGTVVSGATGRNLTMTGSTVRNEGTLRAEAGTLELNNLVGNVGNASTVTGGHLDLDGTYVNDRDLLVIGATLTLRGTWTNAGAINMTNGTVNFDGTFQATDVGGFNRSGGTVNIIGTMDDPGATLALNERTGDWRLQGGRLNGVVVNATGGARLVVVSPGLEQSTFDGVRLEGDAAVSVGGAASVLNGLIVNGTLTMMSEGALIFYSGVQTISGNGQVVMSGSYIHPRGAYLTIGPEITIRNEGVGGGTVGHFLGVLTNRGTIFSGVAGQNVTVTGAAVMNEGTLRAEAGTISISGLIGNSGAFVAGMNGVITITGDLPQAARSAIEVHLAGTGATQFGRLDISGVANLDGALKIVLENGYVPSLGDRFRFMTFTARTGAFATADGFAIGGGLTFTLDTTDPTSLELVVVNQ